ncbi:hypothetical protein NEHOM01_0565, partial [Nematocida homosporus]|uniref:uncharacterized protein n=1 Tax=Nematocida homosporus TaxID=1912981 RepID=UPI0022209FAC
MLKLRLTMKEIAHLIQYLKGNHNKPSDISALQWSQLQEKACTFLTHNSKLYYVGCEEDTKPLEVIGCDDSARLESIFQIVHSKDGHVGPGMLYQKLQCNYVGFSRKAVQEIADECPICTTDKQMPPADCKYSMKHLLIEFIDMRQYADVN